MPGWTADLVLRGLRLAFSTTPRLGESPATLSFLITRAAALLGRRSPEYRGLMLRSTGPAGGLSVRQMCRDRVSWHASRSELYRRSAAGAARVAVALERDGVAVPEVLVPPRVMARTRAAPQRRQAPLRRRLAVRNQGTPPQHQVGPGMKRGEEPA